ncbi:MAG: LacI family transcriptional regulator [Fimbriimonadales bacterium]|jgi:DNA-binding LacI/PurR family transcriptional regulator|nr:LacI family transcriptional regulator [Fimbriimonadales bacterium]GIV11742.1 MAG: LacI family transcriptional regulator [Fimbriimonadales bacterium]CUU08576.1 transcriptional regulator, LacI family [Armatimonadetes bacterium GBS]CUU38244.1 transcriptional regulator, LacI family [Armatimonadetes bacterium GXS]
MKRTQEITIRELAESLGVSVATVSRAIHGRGRISPETRARVLEQMERMGYVPNLHAQSLARRHSTLIALEYLGQMEVLSDVFLIELGRAIQAALVKHGYRLLMNLVGDSHYRQSTLRQWINSRLISGVILIGNPDVSAEWLKPLVKAHIPTVLIAYHPPAEMPDTMRCVVLDVKTGWQEAIAHLTAEGHRQFAYIGSHPEDPALDYICEALRQHRGVLVPEGVLYANETPLGGYEATRRLLQHAQRPTAILARTDLLAMGVLLALQEAGLSVPHHISVVGHDDIPMAQWLIPPLSTIRIDYAILGEKAVESLVHLLQKEKSDTEPVQTVATRFVVRQSTTKITQQEA